MSRFRRGRPMGHMRHTRERGDPRKFRGLGLTCWLRRNYGITLTSGAISAWSDFAGITADWTQGTAGDRPAPSGGGADFDGTDDFLTGPAPSELITAAAYTVFIAFNVDEIATNVAATYENVALVGHGSSALFGVHLKSAPTAHAYNWDGSDDHADADIALATTTIVTARHGSGSIGVRVNSGTEVTASSGNTTDLANATEMGRGSGADANCYNGKEYHAIFFNTHLAADIQTRIRKAIAADMGVAL